MNESYRMGEQSIIVYLQQLANGVSTAELDVAALPRRVARHWRAVEKDACHPAARAPAA